MHLYWNVGLLRLLVPLFLLCGNQGIIMTGISPNSTSNLHILYSGEMIIQQKANDLCPKIRDSFCLSPWFDQCLRTHSSWYSGPRLLWVQHGAGGLLDSKGQLSIRSSNIVWSFPSWWMNLGFPLSAWTMETYLISQLCRLPTQLCQMTSLYFSPLKSPRKEADYK